MYFDIEQLDARRSYKLLTATVVPRPIAWVVTLDAAGKANAAPFSFFNVFSGFPPVICLGIGRRDGRDKDTMANIRAHGEFVINLVPHALVEAMNITAIDFPPGFDELEAAGLATAASSKVTPPRIAESPVAIECALKDVMDVDTTGFLVVGHVRAMHIRDEAVVNAEKCYVDTAKLDLVGRMHSPGGYVRTTDRFTLPMKGFEDWRKG